jgi:hypothetical protein
MNTRKTIFRTIKNNRFLTIDKTFINDPKLSLQAKGLLTYLLSKPDNYSHNETDISNHCANGRDSIRNSLKELIKANYLFKHIIREPSGKFLAAIWYVLELPEFVIQITSALSQENVNSPGPQTSDRDLTSSLAYPPPENPSTVNPQPENPPLNKNEEKSMNDFKKINPSDFEQMTNDPFRSLLASYGVKLPDDYDKIDRFELQLSFDYFMENRRTIKNPVSYLNKILEKARRLTNQEQMQLVERDTLQEKNTEFEKRVEAFKFLTEQEQREAMIRFSHLNNQFTIFLNNPRYLPPMGLHQLKVLVLKELDSKKG